MTPVAISHGGVERHQNGGLAGFPRGRESRMDVIIEAECGPIRLGNPCGAHGLSSEQVVIVRAGLRCQSRSSIRIGRSRIRLPVAWKTAFATAAAVPTLPSSPKPLMPRAFTW